MMEGDGRNPLNDVQLAYARVVCLLERMTTDACDYDDMVTGVRVVMRQVRALGHLNSKEHWAWQLVTPLHLLHDFSDGEKALLLDLADAGGVLKGRTYDRRFDGLGSGLGGKKAVAVSAMGNTWTTRLTERGAALVERWKGEDDATE